MCRQSSYDVGGLASVKTVGMQLWLFRNDLLRSCCGLFPIVNANGVVGAVSIHDNGAGCNSAQDILDGGPCTTAVNETTWSNAKLVYRD